MSFSLAHPHLRARDRQRPPARLRSRVWLRRHRLDLELARGVAPGTSPELALRAEQLTSRRCRRSFAAGITRVVEAAEEPQNPRTSAVPVMRADILACRRELADLSALLSSREELQLRGLAQLEAFLTAGESPLFNPNPEDTLEHAARRIRAALLLR